MATIDGYGLCDIGFDGYAQLAKKVIVKTVTMYTGKIRVVFDRPMKKNNALLNVNNYTIIPSSLDYVTPVINSITTENVTNPSWIDLNCSEHTYTGAANYQLDIDYNENIVDLYDVPIDPATASKTYIGIGAVPTISSITAISKNLISVKFSEAMLDEKTIRDPNRYTFDNGLTTVGIFSLDGDELIIITSDQQPGTLYTMTVTQP